MSSDCTNVTLTDITHGGEFQIYSLAYLCTRRRIRRAASPPFTYSSLGTSRKGKHTTFKTFKWRGCVRVIFKWTNQRARRLRLLGADWLTARRSTTGRGVLLITNLKVELNTSFVFHNWGKKVTVTVEQSPWNTPLLIQTA